MKIKIKKGGAAVLAIIMFLAFIVFFMSNSKNVLACGDPDTYTVRILDPNGVQVRNGSATIDDINGQVSPPCNNAQTDVANASASCQIAGTYTADVVCPGCSGSGHTVASTNVLTCYAAEANKFLIRNSSGGNVAAFDEKGFVYLRGFNFSKQASLTPTPNSYVIKNNTGTTVAYINSSGSLFLTGSISISQAAVSAPINSFVIRNGTRKDVGYIDSSGNLVLSGVIYHNWTDPI